MSALLRNCIGSVQTQRKSNTFVSDQSDTVQCKREGKGTLLYRIKVIRFSVNAREKEHFCIGSK